MEDVPRRRRRGGVGLFGILRWLVVHVLFPAAIGLVAGAAAGFGAFALGAAEERAFVVGGLVGVAAFLRLLFQRPASNGPPQVSQPATTVPANSAGSGKSEWRQWAVLGALAVIAMVAIRSDNSKSREAKTEAVPAPPEKAQMLPAQTGPVIELIGPDGKGYEMPADGDVQAALKLGYRV